jgi:hypothetical protein
VGVLWVEDVVVEYGYLTISCDVTTAYDATYVVQLITY